MAASAPGKVVLCGEYAVLQGAPAVCMAVNRRARIVLDSGETDCHTLHAPGYCEGKWRFRCSSGGVEWIDPLPAPRAFVLVEEVFRRSVPEDVGSLTISVDTREFADAGTGRKFGLGASAAVAVALTAALTRLCDSDARTSNVLAIAADAHRAFQGGRGSGIDIATSGHGGIVEFRQADPARPAALAWPSGLYCAFLFSGQSASTTAMLANLARGQRGKADRDLVACGTAAANAWRGGDVADVLNALRACAVALRAFDRDHALGIFDAGHAGLMDLAAGTDVVFKPCGAGGGDLGAVFADDSVAVERFAAIAARSGFTTMNLAADPHGVICPDLHLD